MTLQLSFDAFASTFSAEATPAPSKPAPCNADHSPADDAGTPAPAPAPKRRKCDDIKDSVSKIILDGILERGNGWAKPWATVETCPFNPATGTRYTGSNLIALMDAIVNNQWEDPRFMTFAQIKKRGCKVAKGSHGAGIVKFKRQWAMSNLSMGVLSGQKFVFLRPQPKTPEQVAAAINMGAVQVGCIVGSYTVHNATNIEGLQPWEMPAPMERGKLAEAFIAAALCPVKISRLNSRAYYTPSANYIAMPGYELFFSEADFVRTLAHEIIHSTKAEGHLSRPGYGGAKGTPAYAREELVAEIGAMLLCAYAGVMDGTRDNDENSMEYLRSWLQGCAAKDQAAALQEVQGAIAMATKAAAYVWARLEPYLDPSQNESDAS